MLEVLRQDYIRTAWAKGLLERAVILRHAVQNALIPVVSLVALQVPIPVGGSVIMEVTHPDRHQPQAAPVRQRHERSCAVRLTAGRGSCDVGSRAELARAQQSCRNRLRRPGWKHL